MSENETLYYKMYHKWKKRIDNMVSVRGNDDKIINELQEGLKELVNINRTWASNRKTGNLGHSKNIDGSADYEYYDSLYKNALIDQDDSLNQIYIKRNEP